MTNLYCYTSSHAAQSLLPVLIVACLSCDCKTMFPRPRALDARTAYTLHFLQNEPVMCFHQECLHLLDVSVQLAVALLADLLGGLAASRGLQTAKDIDNEVKISECSTWSQKCFRCA